MIEADLGKMEEKIQTLEEESEFVDDDGGAATPHTVSELRKIMSELRNEYEEIKRADQRTWEGVSEEFADRIQNIRDAYRVLRKNMKEYAW
jgi:dsDNA-specific endonuclease/ATPase MutS2